MDDNGVNLPEGTVISGKYRVERIIGQGGMGVVLLGSHIKLEEPVAIKVLLPEMAKNQEVAHRFIREARTAVRIKSEHVVRVLDVDVLEDGTPYMVMERLRGSDLSDCLQQKGTFDVSTAARYLIQACDAMAAAHVLGIVHRDMKSANLFLCEQDDHSQIVKVLDFGISKAPSDAMSGQSLTATQALLGTPLYMSPEQLQSTKTVDPRADIWGLGCVLFELLTGGLPFARNTLPELCTAILCEAAPRPSAWSSAIPAEMDAIVAKCLEKQAAARYTTVLELATALLPFAPDMSPLVERIARRFRTSHPGLEAPSLGEVRVTSAPPAATRITPVVSERPPSLAPGSRRGGIVLGIWIGGAATLALAAIGVVLWATRSVPIQPESVGASSALATSALVAKPVVEAATAPPAVAPVVSPVATAVAVASSSPASSSQVSAAEKPVAAPAGPAPVYRGKSAGATGSPRPVAAAASSSPAKALSAPIVAKPPPAPVKTTAAPVKGQSPLFLQLK